MSYSHSLDIILMACTAISVVVMQFLLVVVITLVCTVIRLVCSFYWVIGASSERNSPNGWTNEVKDIDGVPVMTCKKYR